MNHCVIPQLIVDPRGDMLVLEGDKIPFEIKRVFWCGYIPAKYTHGRRKGEPVVRGGHSHKSCEQVIFAISGSFDAELTYLNESKVCRIGKGMGVYVGKDISVKLTNFMEGSAMMVLCSETYDKEDYVHHEFSTIEYLDEDGNVVVTEQATQANFLNWESE